MRLNILHKREGAIWVGPDISWISRETYYSVFLGWGWDSYGPLSILPHYRKFGYDAGGDVYALSWLGFTVSGAILDVSQRMEVATRILNNISLISWKR